MSTVQIHFIDTRHRIFGHSIVVLDIAGDFVSGYSCAR